MAEVLPASVLVNWSAAALGSSLTGATGAFEGTAAAADTSQEVAISPSLGDIAVKAVWISV